MSEELEQKLGFMAAQIRSWLEWDKKSRDKERLVTDDGTHIMALPVPFWPTHGAFESWIKTLEAAARALPK